MLIDTSLTNHIFLNEYIGNLFVTLKMRSTSREDKNFLDEKNDTGIWYVDPNNPFKSIKLSIKTKTGYKNREAVFQLCPAQALRNGIFTHRYFVRYWHDDLDFPHIKTMILIITEYRQEDGSGWYSLKTPFVILDNVEIGDEK